MLDVHNHLLFLANYSGKISKRIIVMIKEKQACVNFWSAKILTGILRFANIVIDCNIVDIPPKLMVNEQRQIAKNLFVKLDKSIEPFVISIMPSKKYDISVGKSEKIGDRHSITIKNISATLKRNFWNLIQASSMKLSIFWKMNKRWKKTVPIMLRF